MQVLVPEPSYATYAATVAEAGGAYAATRLNQGGGFDLGADELAGAIASRRPAAVLLTNPQNPAGNVAPAAALERVAEACAEAGSQLIVDEVYGPLAFSSAPWVSVASLEKTRGALCVGSFSKAGLRPGWRVGWLAYEAGTRLERDAVSLSKAVLFGTTPAAQAAALAAVPSLMPGNAEAARYERRLGALEDALSGQKLLRLHPPQAGMFAMVNVAACGFDGSAFAARLLDAHGVSVLPGAAFGAKDWVRVGLLADEAGMRRAGDALIATARTLAAKAGLDVACRDGSSDTRPSTATQADDAAPRFATIVGGAENRSWALQFQEQLRRQDPRAELALWTEEEGASEESGFAAAAAAVRGADAVFAWQPPRGIWQVVGEVGTTTKLVLSLGVGTDSLAAAGAPPTGIALGRIVDPEAAERLGRYALTAALQHCVGLGPGASGAAGMPTIDPADCPVGVMGSGAFGATAARALAAAGFDVRIWSRSRPPAAGLGCADLDVDLGEERLDGFLRRTRVLVLALPAVAGTASLVGYDQLKKLQPGGCVINVGRGEVLCSHGLLRALNEAHLSSATLDVTDPEPLPEGHPLLAHPKARVTPHVAGVSTAHATARLCLDAWASVRAGRPPQSPVEPWVTVRPLYLKRR